MVGSAVLKMVWSSEESSIANIRPAKISRMPRRSCASPESGSGSVVLVMVAVLSHEQQLKDGHIATATAH